MRVVEGLVAAALTWPFLTALTACEHTGPPTPGPGIDTLPGGTVRVDNLGASWTPATAWRLEEDLRLGTIDDARPEEQFGGIAALLTDEAGRIYVLDSQSQEVRVFDAEGSFSHVIGGPGEGPGELTSAAGLNLGPWGRLWVYDPRAGFHVFELDGTFVERHRRIVGGVIFPWLGTFGRDGHLYDWGLDFPGWEGGATVDVARYIPFRVSDDFQSVDSLPPLEYRSEMGDPIGVPFGGALTIYQDRDASIWFALTREYAIHRRAPDGDTTLVFSLLAPPAAVSEAERDSVLQRQSELPPQFRVAPDAIPSTKPIVRRIFSDNDRYVYVIIDVDGSAVGTTVDAFSDDGVYLGRMESPERIVLPMPPPHATRDHLYVVVTDEFDVPYVSRLRIVRP